MIYPDLSSTLTRNFSRRPEILLLPQDASTGRDTIDRLVIHTDELEDTDAPEAHRQMKALILTHGTRGDVQPFVALAQALKAAGHSVTLGAPDVSATIKETDGIQFVPFENIVEGLLSNDIVRTGIATNFRGIHGVPRHIWFALRLRQLKYRMLDELVDAIQHDVDVVIHHAGLPGHEIAEHLGVPAAPACLAPFLVPTSSFAYPNFRYRVPKTFNRATYLQFQLRRIVHEPNTRKWRRKRLGLPYRRSHSDPLHAPKGIQVPVLQAFSRHILPEDLDYPNWVHTTGFWFPQMSTRWQPPKELAEFLSCGEPPVFIGFGSMIGDANKTRSIVKEAVHQAGVRAVVARGWGGIARTDIEDDILYIEDAPFDWLFPRMSAIVHHGGGGTAAVALNAGRPQVTCPFIYDQHFFARRMYASGVSPAPLLQRDLNPATLANAIHQAVTDPTLIKRAEQLGTLVRAEDGAMRAVKVLEQIT